MTDSWLYFLTQFFHVPEKEKVYKDRTGNIAKS